MSTATQPATTLEQRVVEMVSHTNQVIKQASAVMTQAEKQAAAVAAAIPKCIKALVDNERINAADAEKFASALKDPVNAIELLRKLAGHRNASENTLGTPVEGDGQKTAAAKPTGRAESPLRESDKKLFQGLGLRVPTS